MHAALSGSERYAGSDEGGPPTPALREEDGLEGINALSPQALLGRLFFNVDNVDVFQRAGATTELEGAYTSWPPNPDSPLLALMEQVYSATFGTAPEVAAIHAGLETSVAGERFPGMDMISVGATIVDLHTWHERVEVATVAKAYELLVETLRAVP